MFEFMKKTNESNDQAEEIDFNVNLGSNSILDQQITCKEIKMAVKKLEKQVLLEIDLKKPLKLTYHCLLYVMSSVV